MGDRKMLEYFYKTRYELSEKLKQELADKDTDDAIEQEWFLREGQREEQEGE